MRILDSKKDYYDYLVGVYGEDPLLFYDRRGSETMLRFPNTLNLPSGYDEMNVKLFAEKIITNDSRLIDDKRYFFESSDLVLKPDEPRHLIEREYMCSSYFHQEKGSWKKNETFEGRISHFILEVGVWHYMIETERYIDQDGKIVLSGRLTEKKEVPLENRYTDVPVAIIYCTYNKYAARQARWGHGNGDRFPPVKKNKPGNPYEWEVQGIVNPILKETYIPKIVSADEMWRNITEYLGRTKEKPFKDSRTDVQKLESAGFDKKISFRNVK